MNNQQTGIVMLIGVCCVWPVLFHLGITRILPAILRRDWHSLRDLLRKDHEE